MEIELQIRCRTLSPARLQLISPISSDNDFWEEDRKSLAHQTCFSFFMPPGICQSDSHLHGLHLKFIIQCSLSYARIHINYHIEFQFEALRNVFKLKVTLPS